MKFIHLSDLHIGKKLNGFSLLEDQEYILGEILEGIRREKPQAVLISGDVYDKSTPSYEAVRLLDRFLDALDIDGLSVFVISGNHDSPDRLSFGSGRMKKSGLFIKGGFDGELSPVVLEDEYGPVNFYLLPFIRIADVNYVYGTDIKDYTEAFQLVIEKMQLDPSQRNVLLSHQYVAGAVLSESESTVGSLDSIAAEVYQPFDYTALGHIHRPQFVIGDRLCYCGTPLKYSYSEIGYEKSYTIVTLGGKTSSGHLCDITTEMVPLIPKRDIREIKASFDDFIAAERDDNGIVTNDYIYAVLTDEFDIPDAIGHLRKLYPNILNVKRENANYDTYDSVILGSAGIDRDPFELFSEFYAVQHDGNEPDEKSAEILKKAIAEIWGDENETD
ncbi:MAG: exonuclease SbcCD subunit D [Clostridia bacterium]|nr:exonuclease SbcCD subunit D [Clostridia bacterium]